MYKFQVLCLSAADGKVLWRETARESKPTIPTQASNTYATETPVTDGERVYAYFGMHGLYAYDFAGKQVWKLDLGTFPMAMGFGTGSSPALGDGKVFVQCDNERDVVPRRRGREDRQGAVADEAHRADRVQHPARLEEQGADRGRLPRQPEGAVVRPGDRQAALGAGRDGRPAEGQPRRDGRLADRRHRRRAGRDDGRRRVRPAGRAEGRARRRAQGRVRHGRRQPPLFAVKPGASGDITLKDGAKSSDAVAWTDAKAGPQTPSPLVYQGHLYVLDERGGSLTCYDVKTGKQQYKERLGGRGFTSSPWAYDGKVFCLDDSGTTHVVQAGPTFKELGKNVLDGMCWSSPAVGNGGVFLRTVDTLYCLRTSK